MHQQSDPQYLVLYRTLIAACLIVCGTGVVLKAEDSGHWQKIFETLTVPTEVLPADCELAPGVGLPFGPPKKLNPMVTTNPMEIGLLCGFMLMPGPKDDLTPNDVPAVSSKSRFQKARELFQVWSAEQSAKIEAAYLARYFDRDLKEHGVWALKFKDPKEAQRHFNRLRKVHESDHRHFFMRDSILILAWADSDDSSCIDAIRRHLNKVSLMKGSVAKMQLQNQPARTGVSPVVLEHVTPTRIGSVGHHRRGVELGNAPVFQEDKPLLRVPDTDGVSNDFSITRLFWCKESNIPTGDRRFKRVDVNLWIPVPNGPFAHIEMEDRVEGYLILRPTRPLSDGVYALHNGKMEHSEADKPRFFSPFVVRGYGRPEINQALIVKEGSKVDLKVVIRNQGDGVFDDGFLVVTLQRVESGGSKFVRRHHEQINPIKPMENRDVTSTWNVSELKGGEYYFYGHVNYKYLWDVNSLDTFRSDKFWINQHEDIPSTSDAAESAHNVID